MYSELKKNATLQDGQEVLLTSKTGNPLDQQEAKANEKEHVKKSVGNHRKFLSKRNRRQYFQHMSNKGSKI